MSNRKKVGIALGAGGARGFAHIGVLKVLEENNIHLDMISGTSMGALVGAIYSANPNIKKLEKEFIEENWKKYFDFSLLPRWGLLKGDKIEKWLESKIGNISFNELKIPTYITSFDLKDKQKIIFNKGHVAGAVRASISIPGFFIPVGNKGRYLVDGGVTDPIPSEILEKKGAEVIIAVNVNTIVEKEPVLEEFVPEKNSMKIPNIISVAANSIRVGNSLLSKFDSEQEEIDILIDVEGLEDIDVFEFKHLKKAIKAGEEAARKKLPEIIKAIEKEQTESLISRMNPFAKFGKINSPLTDLGDVKSIDKNLKKIFGS